MVIPTLVNLTHEQISITDEFENTIYEAWPSDEIAFTESTKSSGPTITIGETTHPSYEQTITTSVKVFDPIGNITDFPAATTDKRYIVYKEVAEALSTRTDLYWLERTNTTPVHCESLTKIIFP